MSAFAQRRFARDVLGKRPFSIHHERAESILTDVLGCATSAWLAENDFALIRPLADSICLVMCDP
ncbi:MULTISPECIES: hypothetical protein [unclassified Mesorhizobium]|uniref:hypothetical protein n=1 Tax=unclassified Mesorhizobium TaxID=325217 RepID=UPI00112B439E|nr:MULTISPECIES: hypothetical protein [unclassified Mesorhizobium]TPK84484.1 hypothetical protein FJ548_17605 [Mesorhizobium sp. B2-4-17]TPL01953.1 hypothetical protein FJ938_20320 [Mesorhizobium sp. B2-4-14]UCI31676.1 hypothetical protein FJW03_28615 [Mesorhizobium sp. B4-1-4]